MPSLVGSEMCIRDRKNTDRAIVYRDGKFEVIENVL